jgi:hypothetical protein
MHDRVNLWLEVHLVRGKVFSGGEVGHEGEDGCVGGAEPPGTAVTLPNTGVIRNLELVFRSVFRY